MRSVCCNASQLVLGTSLSLLLAYIQEMRVWFKLLSAEVCCTFELWMKLSETWAMVVLKTNTLVPLLESFRRIFSKLFWTLANSKGRLSSSVLQDHMSSMIESNFVFVKEPPFAISWSQSPFSNVKVLALSVFQCTRRVCSQCCRTVTPCQFCVRLSCWLWSFCLKTQIHQSFRR